MKKNFGLDVMNNPQKSISGYTNTKQFIYLFYKTSVKSPNAVWGLYVVIGNTNISFGPAQFVCKAR